MSKKITPKYLPTTSNQARAHIMEEAGEVLAAYGKAMRFGWHSYNPHLPKKKRETNEIWFLRELCDLEDAIKRYREMQKVGNP